MSTYVESSRISDINRRAADEAVPAGEELFQLIRRSLDISVLTRGAFDITYDSVGQYYDFRRRQRPDTATVEKERDRIDYRLVELDAAAGTVHFLADGVRINLGGIAKGYAIDIAFAMLHKMGIENAVVNAGGDVRAIAERWTDEPTDAFARAYGTEPDDEPSFLWAIHHGYGDEGIWTEPSQHYHHYTMDHVLPFTLATRHATQAGVEEVLTTEPSLANRTSRSIAFSIAGCPGIAKGRICSTIVPDDVALKPMGAAPSGSKRILPAFAPSGDRDWRPHGRPDRGPRRRCRNKPRFPQYDPQPARRRAGAMP